MTLQPETSLPAKSAVGSGHRWQDRGRAIPLILGIIAVVGLILYLSFGLDGSTSSSRSARDKDPLDSIPVVAAPVRQGNLDIYLFALGTVTPVNSAVVRARVDGQILSIAFEEGQMVKAGELLAQIDPRPFEMQLALSSGQLARAQAMLENAQVDLERYRTLLAQDSISSQQVDTQESLVRQQKAAVQAEQGAVDNAKLQLAHAKVVSPIAGRVGLRQVSPGNVVRTSDATGIAVVTQLRPVNVVFPIPEDSLPRVMKRLRSGDKVAVEAFDRSMKDKLGTGRLLTADNQIDPTTGTIKLKAEFANAEDALIANQFVNVRMALETRVNATLVPSAAVQRGAKGSFVYVVKDDQTVAVSPVQVGPVQGEVTAIEGGVAAGEIVVIDGADRLRDGAKVTLIKSDQQGDERRTEARNSQASGGG